METSSLPTHRRRALQEGERLALLVEAGRRLLDARRPEELATRLCEVLCARLVESCTVELLGAPGPSALPLLTEALRRLPEAARAQERLTRVLGGGEPEAWDAAPEGGPRAVLLPLRGEGATRGLVLLTGRGLSPDALALAGEVLALATRGLELATRHEAARAADIHAERTRRRLEGLQALTQALATAHTPEEVARAVVEEAVRVQGARSGSLFLLEPDASALRLVHAVGYGEEAREHFARVPLEATVPVADATRSGQPVWLHCSNEYAARYPEAAAHTHSTQRHNLSVACLPLVGRGPRGCLALSFSGPSAFEAEERAWLGGVAHQCAMALERVHLLAAERRHAARAEYLERFATTLATSLEVDETLRHAAALVLPELADFCFFDVRSPEGDVRRLALAHQSPERQRLLDGTRWVPAENPETSTCALVRGAPVFLPRIDDAWMRAHAAGPEHLELLRALGLCSMVSVPLRTQAGILGALTLCFAQSGRHHTEEDLTLAVELGRRAAVAVENAQLFHQARGAVRLRDDFLAIASHELNTPLTTLKLHLGRLLRTSTEADTRARVAVADQQVDRLARLVRELLDVSRLSEGRLRVEPGPVELGALCREVLGRFEAERARVGTALRLRAPEPVRGHWDGPRLEQVVTNLVGNALKYGRGQPVELEVTAAGGEARLVVRDRGIGIAPEQQARLFRRFERGVSVRHYGGFGLGLWMVRQVVEAHGGHIQVESTLDVGTTFTVTLPLPPPG